MLAHEIHNHPIPNTQWVVFIHGAGGSTRTFRRQIAAFGAAYNLLLIDLRDHGNSVDLPLPKGDFGFNVIANDVITLLEHLNIPSAHFVSVSMGSIFLREIEKQKTNIVKSMIIGGGMFDLSQKINIFMGVGSSIGQVIPFQWLYWGLATVVFPKKNHAKSKEIFIQEASKIKQEAFNRWIKLAPTVKTALKGYFNNALHMPCLIVSGQEDHMFIGTARQYAQKYPQVEFVEIKKCGHVVSIEQSDVFNAISLAFLKKHFPIAQQ